MYIHTQKPQYKGLITYNKELVKITSIKMNIDTTHLYKTVTWWQLGDKLRATSTKNINKKKERKEKSSRFKENYDKTETKKSYSHTNRSKHHPTEDTPRHDYTVKTMSRNSFLADLISSLVENAPRYRYAILHTQLEPCPEDTASPWQDTF